MVSLLAYFVDEFAMLCFSMGGLSAMDVGELIKCFL